MGHAECTQVRSLKAVTVLRDCRCRATISVATPQQSRESHALPCQNMSPLWPAVDRPWSVRISKPGTMLRVSSLMTFAREKRLLIALA